MLALELADIAGVEPAFVIDNLLRCIGHVEISDHSARTADEDFAVARDLHFDAGDRLADSPRLVAIGVVHAGGGGGFGEAVALQHIQAKAAIEVGNMWRERGAAGNEEPNAAPGGGRAL